MNIPVEDLSDIIARELTQYSKEITDDIKDQAKKSMRKLVNETKLTAPVGKRKHHYKSSIKSRKLSESVRSVTYVWYVDGSDYRLSHLLEDGHVSRNGGRVSGTHFISKAADKITKEFEKAVEEVIKNG
ncbi:HK97 gp10 family phage protein [Anaerovoracaceae bacterium 41-7]|uniref:HK97 gp10 family phage protein n=1 Tax=Emergencia sp. JLR.KK010 TaxID=3114296 RepID=UPI0030D01550